MNANIPASVSTAGAGHPSRRATFTRIAWWSILLGLIMEGLLLVIRMNQSQQLQPVAEGLGKISWALLVCLGLGLGKVISGDKPLWMGLSGLVSAPLAFTVMQSVQKAVTELLSSTPDPAALTSASLVVAVLRGAEYMCLGIALALITQRQGGLRSYLAAGLIAGVAFGGIVLLRTPSATQSVAAILSWAVNELLFPVGCALVLYAGETLAGQASA